MVRWEAKRGNAAGCALDIFDALLVSASVGVVAGRIGAMITAGINPLQDVGQVLLVRSGVSTPVAASAAILTFVFLARRNLPALADAAAPSAVAGLASWHGSCVVNNACLGTESSLPWAMTLPGSSVTRHPVELYAAVALAAVAAGLALWKQHGRPPLGAVTGTALFAASATRLATEGIRISLTGGPVWFYATGCALGAGIVVASFLHAQRSVEAGP